MEMGFIESEQDVMSMLSETIAAIFESLRANCGKELSRRKLALPELKAIPQIDLLEAQKVLREKFGKTTGVEGDLDTEAEKLIGQWAEQELKSPLLFVTGYSVACRPVYTMPLESDPARTRSFDLLYRGVEISTGGQRIHLYAQLIESFKRRGLNPADAEGYLECFRHGMPPHSGMGLGLERFTKQLLILSNVKEASLFPRDRNRLIP
jgi:nondiscriminating aspartyl-tRNA synthetase